MTYTKPFEERSFGPQEYEIEGVKVIHNFREHWIRGNRRIPARCGISGEFEFQSSRGISVSEICSLESTIEGTIGVEALVSLKSSITETSGSDLTISREETERVTLSCPSTDCGSAVYHLYQLVRDHRLEFHKSRFLRSSSIAIETPREFVGEYDFDVENIRDDPNCPCPQKSLRTGAGWVRLILNRLRITAEYDQLLDGRLQVELGDSVYGVNTDKIVIPASSFPRGWIELAGLPIASQEIAIGVELLSAPEDTFLTVKPIIVPEDGSSSGTPSQGL
jgi:hypothetical protein